jgi:hypothetical protein
MVIALPQMYLFMDHSPIYHFHFGGSSPHPGSSPYPLNSLTLEEASDRIKSILITEESSWEGVHFPFFGLLIADFFHAT